MNTTSVVKLDHKLIFQTYILMCMCKYGMDFEEFFQFCEKLEDLQIQIFQQGPTHIHKGL